MTWRIGAAMMLVPLAAMAQGAPQHEVGPGGLAHGPVSFAAFESRIDQILA